jgi:hypothetical protein
MAEMKDCGKLCGFPTAGNPDPITLTPPTYIFNLPFFNLKHTHMLHASCFNISFLIHSKSNNMTLTQTFTIIFLLFALYCGLDPFNHSPISNFPNFDAKKIDMPPWSEIPDDRDEHNLLQNSEIKFLNQVQGPESIVFDPLGRGPYTGLADGTIVFWNGHSWLHFAYTSPNRFVTIPFLRLLFSVHSLD